MVDLAVINYGIGNLRSLERSLQRINIEAAISDDRAVLANARRLLLPGVGHFRACMRAFNESGVRPLLQRRVAEGTPVLGICVGMQMLFEGSDEGSFTEGLGFLEGRVTRFPKAVDGITLRVPHVGFSQITTRESVLFEGMISHPRFYFTHSFRVADAQGEDVVGVGHYGGDFAAAVQSGCVYGTQFHPEKSHRAGLALLKNFATKG